MRTAAASEARSAFDTEQERQRAMVHGNGLSNLQEPDELEPVQPLSARLIGLDLWEPHVDRGVGSDVAIDVSEPEEPADAAGWWKCSWWPSAATE